jgi:hypothetical protein
VILPDNHHQIHCFAVPEADVTFENAFSPTFTAYIPVIGHAGAPLLC